MSQIPKATPNNNPFHENDSDVELVKKADVIKDAGFTPKQAERFQILAKNTDIVEQAKERQYLGLKSDKGGRTDEAIAKVADV